MDLDLEKAKQNDEDHKVTEQEKKNMKKKLLGKDPFLNEEDEEFSDSKAA